MNAPVEIDWIARANLSEFALTTGPEIFSLMTHVMGLAFEIVHRCHLVYQLVEQCLASFSMFMPLIAENPWDWIREIPAALAIQQSLRKYTLGREKGCIGLPFAW